MHGKNRNLLVCGYTIYSNFFIHMALIKEIRPGFIALFFPPPSLLSMPAVGIDISDRSVKYAEFHYHDGRTSLNRLGERPVPEGIMDRGVIGKPEELTSILSKLKVELGLSTVRVSLPEEHVYIFQTLIPEGTRVEQVRTLLEFQLEEHVPVPAPDAIFDYEFLKPNGRSGSQVSVSVCAKSFVENYLNVVRAAG